MTISAFQKKVWRFYQLNRRDFPWRQTTDPYKILVSEVMLQQTQTYRVVPKYEAFIQKFPTVSDLAKAPLAAVLKQWQGLGYNRRALMLHRAAKVIAVEFDGKVPSSVAELVSLSGVGQYTASAILAFAFNKPAVMIETNIRAAFIHEFFPRKKKVHDAQLLPLIKRAAPAKDVREFYYALMDYGAFLKQKYPNPSRRSAHHSRQSKFAGSDRQIRGQIVRLLATEGQMPETVLVKRITDKKQRTKKILNSLIGEGLVVSSGERVMLPA